MQACHVFFLSHKRAHCTPCLHISTASPGRREHSNHLDILTTNHGPRKNSLARTRSLPRRRVCETNIPITRLRKAGCTPFAHTCLHRWTSRSSKLHSSSCGSCQKLLSRGQQAVAQTLLPQQPPAPRCLCRLCCCPMTMRRSVPPRPTACQHTGSRVRVLNWRRRCDRCACVSHLVATSLESPRSCHQV